VKGLDTSESNSGCVTHLVHNNNYHALKYEKVENEGLGGTRE